MNNFVKMNLKYLVKLKNFWKTLLKLTPKEMRNLNTDTTIKAIEQIANIPHKDLVMIKKNS